MAGRAPSPRRLGLTTRASCLLAAGLTAVVCGVVLGETDLVRAGVLAAAVPLVAALVVHRSRLQVANRRAVEPRRIRAGDTVTVHLTVTNRSVLPTGALMLEDGLPGRITGRARFVVDGLGGHDARTVSYRIPALGRGRYRVGPLRIRLADPFGLVELTRSFTTTTEFLVTPRVDTLPAGDLLTPGDPGGGAGSHSVGSHGADDASTREYRTGDDLRKVHWRSSARTGQLMVRQAERPWRAQSTVVLDLRARAHATVPAAVLAAAEADAADAGTVVDERETSSLEWAVSAVAGIGTQALRSGRQLGVVADLPSGARVDAADPDQLAMHLATVRESGSTDLRRLAELVRTSSRESALVAVLGRLDTADVRMLCEAHPRGSAGSAALVLDVDSWAAPSTGGPAPDIAPATAAAAAALRNAGWRVQVVRRGTPLVRAWQLLQAGADPAGRTPVSR